MKRPKLVQANSNFSVRSAVTFLAVGGGATALHYLLAVSVFYIFGTTLMWASAFGFVLSAVANYLLNRRLTFRSLQSHADAAPRFVVTAVAGLLINCLLLFFFGNVLEWHPVVSQLFSTLGVLIWNYSISGFWIFKRQAA